MLTFVIGASGVGKTTFARRIANGRAVLSAGRWARELAAGGGAPDDLAAASLSVLRRDPCHSARLLSAQLAQLPARDAVVEGCRNPTDILMLASAGDRVIDLGGAGASAWERDGLSAIRACRGHLARIGVAWCAYTRYFATLPMPLGAAVRAEFLHTQDGRPDWEPGQILALESYQGQPVTVCWASEAGGIFHDLPLEAFGDAGLGGNCYASAGAGAPVIELPPVTTPAVAVFDRGRKKIGVGESLWLVHWPDDDVLLHLVRTPGGLLLWPPHKLMHNPAAAGLPDWTRRRR